MSRSAPPLTHRHVEVFRAVMAAGSVTGAAAALHTSQPTVSRELARLEQVLGLHLFDRVRGRLQPTAQGYALHEEVQRSYAGLERVADTAVRLRQFTQGQLSIACLPAFAHALLPRVATFTPQCVSTCWSGRCPPRQTHTTYMPIFRRSIIASSAWRTTSRPRNSS